jgi:hypothetical protein
VSRKKVTLEVQVPDVPEPEARTFEAKRPRLRAEERGERLNLYVPSDLATKLRVRCAVERRSLSDAVVAALEAWLKEEPGK